MVSFLEYLMFFRAVFLHRPTSSDLFNDFHMFFGILIFDPKSGFCMDFENGFIFRIFSVFYSGFLHRTILNDLFNGFSHVFRNFNF